MDALFLFDPEIVVPSRDAKNRIDFWVRLASWVEDSRPKLGARTLEGVIAMLETPPLVISPAEFYEVIGRIASRVARSNGVGPNHETCIDAWLEHYAPKLGHSTNRASLRDDIGWTASPGPVLLATDNDCWKESRRFTPCDSCGMGSVYLYASGDNGVERALRTEFAERGEFDFDTLASVSSALFPRVRFSDSAWARVRYMRGDRRELTKTLFEHLAVLNDHAVGIWAYASQTNERIAHLAALGVDASPESPKTRASEKMMKLRDFRFDGVVRRCEWHTKFEPHQNRLHFSITHGVVYVGTIEAHLPVA